MKILVIGGSYFTGRWFVQMAYSKHDISVLNRGNIPVGLPNVRQLTVDRHNEEGLMRILADGKEKYDCIVDFCAYQENDIELISKYFGNDGATYIFVSTVDTYKKGMSATLSEDSPVEDSFTEDETGIYIKGKVLLEKELIISCDRYGMHPCIVRPAIIYGPANYAQREKLFFDWIKQVHQVILPSDSTGEFQMIYVKDVALILRELCEMNPERRHESYNLCSDETIDYDTFARALHEAVKEEFEEIRIPVLEILERSVPLPFPLTEQESERYSGKRLKKLLADSEYGLTPLAEGLKQTFDSQFC